MDEQAIAKKLILKRLREKYNINPNIFINKSSQVKVACILDEFSYNCLKYEVELYQLGLNNWKSIIDSINPDFLFVEAAWEGINKQWSGKISNYSCSKNSSLEMIIKYCNIKGIPTVFWGKEDPYDFSIFIEAAKLFQYIFTTDGDSIDKYKEVLNHENIFLLPFAAQPRIHNPVNKDKENKGNIIFAGGWYKKFPVRSAEMEYLLDAALKYGLTIYDRFSRSNQNKNLFPEKYKDYIVGGLNYLDMINELKKYRILLNTNSVVDSPTNFSRRVYESLACGIPVVSSYALGIDNYFKGIVTLVNNKNEAEESLKLLLNNHDLLDKLSLLGIREVLNNHTYKNRLNEISRVLKLDKDYTSSNNGVSVITITNRKLSLDRILENYTSQNYNDKELIIVINKNSIEVNYWKELLGHRDDIKIFKLDQKISLGECLNFAVENSKYPYISKFDDDDYYGPNYLVDAIHAFSYTDASIVGKYSVYAYMESSNDLILRYPQHENRYMDYIAGSTITFKKEIFSKVQFPRLNKSEDTMFLNEATRLGYKIYSSDRFNHVISRRKNINTHTWKISEKDFRNKAILVQNTKSFKEIVFI